jgi:peptidylprolyl isomerase
MSRLRVGSTLLFVLVALVAFASASPAQQSQSIPAAAKPQAPPPPPEHLTPPPDAQSTADGLAYKVLKPGTGDIHPDDNDLVVVDFTGWKSSDGTVFASSVTSGKPQLLPIEALIQGWTEGMQLMTEGETARFWIPGDLAYKGIEGKPQGMLVFDVTLREIRQIPPVPDDVAAPPADAQRASDGVAWKVLQPGTGTRHPGATDTVKVNYIGWTTDGKWFDSTYSRGKPASLPLNHVIQGWREGLQQMVVGEKARIWIPEDLAYKGEEGKPKGMLVFDVELLDIE